ncbi:hypothetical protein L6164_001689 [Bauhinia variegata]|nr:hypothetical protein L6164_001689 [Bauhinia variegata]
MIQLENKGRLFLLLGVVQSFPYTITIRDENLSKSLQSRRCDGFRDNYTLPISSSLASLQISYNLTMFRCNHTLRVKSPVNLGISNYSCPPYNIYYGNRIVESRSFFTECSMIQLPAKDLPDDKDPFTFISAGFVVHVGLSPDCTDCLKKNGHCRLDRNKFYCVEGDKKSDVKVKLVLAAVGVGVLLIVIYCFRYKLVGSWKNKSKAHQDFEAFLKSHGPLSLIEWLYSQDFTKS